MRVTFEWTQQEWNEAVRLATEQPRRGGSVPGMVYALVGIPLFGAVLDGVTAIKTSGALRRDTAVVPILLLTLAVVIAAAFAVSWWWQRRRRVAVQMPMPGGRWEMVLQESGWRVADAAMACEVVVVADEEEIASAVAEQVEAPIVITAVAAEAVAMEPVSVVVQGDDGMIATQVDPVPVARAVIKEGAAPWVHAVAVEPREVVPEADAAVPAAAAPVEEVVALTEVPEASLAEPVTAAPTAQESEIGVQSAPPQAEADSAPDAAGEAQDVPADAAAVEETVAVAAEAAPKRPGARPLEPWQTLTGSRAGERVIVLLHGSGFYAVPVRCMTPDQASHMHRMVLRKLRPAPAARAVPPGI